MIRGTTLIQTPYTRLRSRPPNARHTPTATVRSPQELQSDFAHAVLRSPFSRRSPSLSQTLLRYSSSSLHWQNYNTAGGACQRKNQTEAIGF